MNPYSPPGVSADLYPGAAPYAPPEGGAVSEKAIDLLRQTRPWVLFLSVMTLALSVLVFAFAALMLVVSAFSHEVPVALALVYLPIGLIYVYPGIKLWSYASAIGRLANTRGGADLEDALGQQKSFWKFCGVASIVMLVVYAVALVLLFAFGAAKALMDKGH